MDLANRCFRTGDPFGIPEADFVAIRKKEPWCFISTCRPILNIVAMWKTITLAGAHFLKGHLLGSGIIPPNQFALFPSSSPDLLRVVHDMALLRWSRGQEVWFVADDVRHAYGSVGHTTCHSSLLAAGVDEGLASLVVSAAKWIKIHYAGPTPAMPVHAHFDGGTGQGDP